MNPKRRNIIRRWSAAAIIFAVLGTGAVYLWANWTSSPERALANVPDRSGDAATIFRRVPAGQHPILLLTDSQSPNRYSGFVSEILKTEGLSSFDTLDIAATPINAGKLARYHLVITTGDANLTRSESLLTSYVRNGGRLFMIAPPAAFDLLLGVRSDTGTLENAYVVFRQAARVTAGLSASPLQFHGAAKLLVPTNAISVASLFRDRGTSTPYSAFGINSQGRGMSAYVAYDLGRSIVFTRQGHPNPPGSSRMTDWDQDGVFRTADLFFNHFDTTNCRIPQGDEQQRLFVRMLDALLEERLVIPRTWYFPAASPSVAVITGDAHQTPPAEIEHMTAYVEHAGGKFSLIEYPTALDRRIVGDLEVRGHSVAPHVYYPRSDNKFPMRVRLKIANGFSPTYFYQPRFADVCDEAAFAVDAFHARTGGTSSYTRMHFLTWWGWAETAHLLARCGFRMDLSVTGLNPHRAFVLPMGNGGLKSPAGFGYINGSGQPMRYIDADGRLVDLFSQLTIVEDDVISGAYITEPKNDSLTCESIVSTMRSLINESISNYHAALVVNFHPEHAVTPFPPNAPKTWPWVTRTIDYLAQRQVPMISADTWLRFIESRYAAEISDITYNSRARAGTFILDAPFPVRGLTILLPLPLRADAPAVVARSVATQNRIATTVRKNVIDDNVYLAIILDLAAADRVKISYAF